MFFNRRTLSTVEDINLKAIYVELSNTCDDVCWFLLKGSFYIDTSEQVQFMIFNHTEDPTVTSGKNLFSSFKSIR